MNIAIVSIHSCPVGSLGTKDTGGMSVYIRETALQLSRLGHTIDIYTRAHDKNDVHIIELDERTRIIHLLRGQEELADKLLIYGMLPDYLCSLENFRSENELHYDVVFSHYWLSGWIGNHLQNWWNVPNVSMFHTLGAVKNAASKADDTELRIQSEKEIIRNCRHIIAATSRECDELAHHYDADVQKISVVPCGVNLSTFHAANKQDCRDRLRWGKEYTILYVGRIDPIKGIDRLIDSIPIIQNKFDVKLVIAGGEQSGDEATERLKLQAANRQLQEHVIFTGRIEQSLLYEYYSAADVCVLPSYHESFGLTALESLACGTPVVAANIGDLPHIISKGINGWIADSNSPEHLADGILRVKEVIPNHDEARKKIRHSVADYSWDAVARNLENILNQECESFSTPVAN